MIGYWCELVFCCAIANKRKFSQLRGCAHLCETSARKHNPIECYNNCVAEATTLGWIEYG